MFDAPYSQTRAITYSIFSECSYRATAAAAGILHGEIVTQLSLFVVLGEVVRGPVE